MAMKLMDIQRTVKATTFNEIKEFFGERAEQYADFEMAIPVEIAGEGEFWAKISVVCGQVKDTTKTKAFDPFFERELWEKDKETKEKIKAEKEKLKAEKLAKSGKAKAE